MGVSSACSASSRVAPSLPSSLPSLFLLVVSLVCLLSALSLPSACAEGTTAALLTVATSDTPSLVEGGGDWQRFVPPAYRSFLPPAQRGGGAGLEGDSEGEEGGEEAAQGGRVEARLRVDRWKETEREEKSRESVKRSRRGDREEERRHSLENEREREREERSAEVETRPTEGSDDGDGGHRSREEDSHPRRHHRRDHPRGAEEVGVREEERRGEGRRKGRHEGHRLVDEEAAASVSLAAAVPPAETATAASSGPSLPSAPLLRLFALLSLAPLLTLALVCAHRRCRRSPAARLAMKGWGVESGYAAISDAGEEDTTQTVQRPASH